MDERAQGQEIERDTSTTDSASAEEVGARQRGSRRWRPRCVAREARDYIHANYTNPGGCSTAEIAAAVGVTPSHLCHQFRVVYGTTMGREIRRLRVRLARRLLEDTDRLVKQVAADVGYPLTSYKTFHNVFRSETGMPPGAYRRWVRDGRDDAADVRKRASGGDSAA